MADRIIVVEKGKIVESGNHDELIKLKGYYEKLNAYQNHIPAIRDPEVKTTTTAKSTKAATATKTVNTPNYSVTFGEVSNRAKRNEKAKANKNDNKGENANDQSVDRSKEVSHD
jgi:ABC-type glutathione transport system ATPase component